MNKLLLIPLVLVAYFSVEYAKNINHHKPGTPSPIIMVGNFRYVVDNDQSKLKVRLPDEVKLLQSNNCVGITYYQGRLFMGFRSSTSHFAGKKTRIYILSSSNNGT